MRLTAQRGSKSQTNVRAAEAKQRSLFDAYVVLSQALKEGTTRLTKAPQPIQGAYTPDSRTTQTPRWRDGSSFGLLSGMLGPRLSRSHWCRCCSRFSLLLPVLAGVLVADFLWRFVRYSFVSPTLAKVGALSTAFLKWPCALGSAIYLFAHQRYVLAVVAALWPLVAGFVNVPVAIVTARLGFPSQIGRIERSLADGIGYVSGG